jgi:aldehyde:ferredoxin oxidoreductase
LDDLGVPDVQVAMIGRAGESLARFANITHSLKKTAGRTGWAAVNIWK